MAPLRASHLSFPAFPRRILPHLPCPALPSPPPSTPHPRVALLFLARMLAPAVPTEIRAVTGPYGHEKVKASPYTPGLKAALRCSSPRTMSTCSRMRMSAH
ncbi:hypothetical protein C8J57DRAFT_1524143 [Mycena rebaudengoi]|nr:hypothetical protein C8J57DRAFT_1524143 [Mycena rebaudengoi]